MIKLTIRYFKILILIFLVTFLLASFYESTFNIKQWHESTRFTTSLITGFAGTIFFLIYTAGESVAEKIEKEIKQ